MEKEVYCPNCGEFTVCLINLDVQPGYYFDFRCRCGKQWRIKIMYQELNEEID